MSGVSGREHAEFFFKDRYATDFLRVTQGDSELPLRHPGSPKTESLRLDGLTVSSGSGSGSGSGVSTGSPHADVMMCPGCKDEFDSAVKRPILLPGCGHTVCSVCVRERAKSLECPVCRRCYPGASVESLPVNISLEALLEGKKGQLTLERIIKEEHNGSKESEAICSSHGLRQSFWCRSCEEAVCGECLFDKHPADTHTLAKLHDVAAEVKETALATVKVCHSDATRLFSGFLMEFVALLGNFHKAGRLMQQSRRLVAAAESADDFHAASAVYKVIKRVNSEVVEMQLEMHDSQHQHDEEEQQDGDEGTEKVPPRSSRQSPSPSAGAVEETSVYAMHTDGRLAKVQTEAHGLHVYSLSAPSSTAYSVAVRLGLLMEFVQRDHIQVFLDFCVDDTCLGRVYVRLRGDMRRSSQFAHLCIGTLGPSYKGTRVDGLDDMGSPGEYLRMGDYTGRGGQGGVGLIDGLEWGNSFVGPKKKGYVVGLGGDAGEKRFGALFGVCLRENLQQTFRCPFGEVTSGMDVLRAVAGTNPLSKVYIGDCGALIPIQ